MSDLELLIDLHLRNDRQGPGDDAETRRAIGLARLDGGRRLLAADVGCGTGASALVLARELGARVTAVDAAGAFVERARERAAAAGLGERIEAVAGRMESLPFEEGALDVIWSEGAIYNMGFEAGLTAWRRFLKPGGVVAVTELSWTTAARPADIERHWASEYPGIATAAANLARMERAGYRPIGMFTLPASAWESYYGPLRAGFGAFLERHGGSEAARAIVESEEAEMRWRETRGEWYGYVFYIGVKTCE